MEMTGDWSGIWVLIDEKIVKAEKKLSVQDIYSQMVKQFAKKEMLDHDWPWRSETLNKPEVKGSYIESWHPPSFVLNGKYAEQLAEGWRIERV